MFKYTNILLETVGDTTFKLTEDLTYHGKSETFVVPAGFETDFASVPRFVQWLIPAYGRYTLAAIVHDWLCVQLEDHYAGKHELSGDEVFVPANSVDVDGIFRRIMQELGVPFVRRWLMWAGVRWGAIFNKARRKGSLSTLLKLLPISLLALPFVVVPTLFVLLGLAIDYFVETLTPKVSAAWLLLWIAGIIFQLHHVWIISAIFFTLSFVVVLVGKLW
jgi:hypothetical protein